MQDRRLIAAAIALLVCSWISGGCVSMARTETGSAPGDETVASLEKGASLDEVLALCGVPVQTLVQPDGLLLIYRERHFDYKRIGFEPSAATAFFDMTGLITEVLSNLKLVLQWGDIKERRLVILFDEDERLLAHAYRDTEEDR